MVFRTVDKHEVNPATCGKADKLGFKKLGLSLSPSVSGWGTLPHLPSACAAPKTHPLQSALKLGQFFLAQKSYLSLLLRFQAATFGNNIAAIAVHLLIFERSAVFLGGYNWHI